MNYDQRKLKYLVLGPLAFIFPLSEALAFTQMIAGFTTLTRSYLLPLSGAVAGCAFILFVILSYFDADRYKSKVAHVIFMAILSAVGLEVINQVITAFGGIAH